MSKKPNSICAICGKEYYCCNDSMTMKSFTPWRKIVDCVEHYKIFLTLRDYTNKVIDKKKAYEELSQYNLTDLDSFKEEIRESINEIMKENQKPKRKKASKAVMAESDKNDNE